MMRVVYRRNCRWAVSIRLIGLCPALKAIPAVSHFCKGAVGHEMRYVGEKFFYGLTRKPWYTGRLIYDPNIEVQHVTRF
jgi:hypothetical protein